MTPLALLRKIRLSSLPDDGVRVLLAIGAGIQRVSDIREATALHEWQTCRMLAVLSGRALIYRVSAASPEGAGKCTVYSLTAEGVGMARDLLSDDGDGEGGKLRPRPSHAPAPLRVSGRGFFFLDS